MTTGELIAEVEVFNLALREMKDLALKERLSEALEIRNQTIKNMGSTRALFYKVKLYLSASDPAHKELDSTLDKLLRISVSDYSRIDDAKSIAELTDQVVALAQIVLKQAWQDAKAINLRDAFRFTWH